MPASPLTSTTCPQDIARDIEKGPPALTSSPSHPPLSSGVRPATAQRTPPHPQPAAMLHGHVTQERTSHPGRRGHSPLLHEKLSFLPRQSGRFLWIGAGMRGHYSGLLLRLDCIVCSQIRQPGFGRATRAGASPRAYEPPRPSSQPLPTTVSRGRGLLGVGCRLTTLTTPGRVISTVRGALQYLMVKRCLRCKALSVSLTHDTTANRKSWDGPLWSTLS